MDHVRDVCSAALALRAATNARVRQPLAKLVVAGPRVEQLRPYVELIADEVNVKQIELSEEVDAYATFRLKLNARAIGPRLGGDTKQVIAASKRGEWTPTQDGAIECGGHRIESDEYELLLEPKQDVACEPLPGNDAIVVLDLELSDELIAEGRARDLVRVVQQARKAAGLHVADRIRLVVTVPDDWRAAIDDFADYIREQTLATRLEYGDASATSGSGLFAHEGQVSGQTLGVGVARIDT
jgi:isoleucyl-tRNA synthetase